MKTLRQRFREKQIEKQEALAVKRAKEKAEQRKKLIVLIVVLVALYGFIGIMALFEDDDESSNKEPIAAQATPKPTATPKSNPSPTPIVTATPVPTEVPASGEKMVLVDSGLTSGLNHIKSDSLIIGTNEIYTFTITAFPSGLTAEDLLIQADDPSAVQYWVEDVDNNEAENKTVYTVKVKGVQRYNSYSAEIDFISNSDGDGYGFPLYILNATDGQTVYYTYSGEKYHFRESCAGDGAFATTLNDAVSAGLEPCGKCAQ